MMSTTMTKRMTMALLTSRTVVTMRQRDDNADVVMETGGAT